MTRSIKIGSIILLTIGLSLTIFDTTWAGDDWQYWSKLSFKTSMNEKVDLKISLQARFKEDFNEFYYWGPQIGPIFKINKYLDISPSYCLVNYKSEGHFKKEHRWILDGILKWKIQNFKFTHRSRLEYRDLPNDCDWRYRDNIWVGAPIKFYDYPLTPFVSEEIFYSGRKNEFNQNRFSIGVSIKIAKDVSLGIYYLLRSDKTGRDWSESNALGTSLDFIF